LLLKLVCVITNVHASLVFLLLNTPNIPRLLVLLSPLLLLLVVLE
jgi:hypothetical protein